jgi:hypothetical protein
LSGHTFTGYTFYNLDIIDASAMIKYTDCNGTY